MRKNKSNILVFSILALAGILRAQTDYSLFEAGTNITFPSVNCQENLMYCGYSVKHKHVSVQLPSTSVDTDTPEGFFNTLVSVHEIATLSKHIQGSELLSKKQEILAFISKSDSLNYWLLDSKIELLLKDNRYTIVKYYHVVNGRGTGPFSLQMLRKADVWTVVDLHELHIYEDVLRQIKYTAFAKILERGFSEDEVIDGFVNQCLTVLGTIDIDKLHKYLQQEISKSSELARYIAEL